MPLAFVACVPAVASTLVWHRYGEWTPMFVEGGHQAGLTIIFGGLFNFIRIMPCLALQVAAYLGAGIALHLSRRATPPFYVAAVSAAVVGATSVILLATRRAAR